MLSLLFILAMSVRCLRERRAPWTRWQIPARHFLGLAFVPILEFVLEAAVFWQLRPYVRAVVNGVPVVAVERGGPLAMVATFLTVALVVSTFVTLRKRWVLLAGFLVGPILSIALVRWAQYEALRAADYRHCWSVTIGSGRGKTTRETWAKQPIPCPPRDKPR